jgi:hypothetical protein
MNGRAGSKVFSHDGKTLAGPGSISNAGRITQREVVLQSPPFWLYCLTPSSCNRSLSFAYPQVMRKEGKQPICDLPRTLRFFRLLYDERSLLRRRFS